MAKHKVLVVGATSTVGRHVVSQLHASQTHSPIAGVRSASKAAAFIEQGIATVHLNLDDVTSVRAAMQGIDQVFLLTGYTVDMVIQSKLVVDQAVQAGVQKIVHMGAWAPDDTDLGHFGWHQMIERYIQGSGLDWTHVAPGMFMENMLGGGTLWGAFSGKATSDSKAIHAFTGHGRLGWIAAEDIAFACIQALTLPERHNGKKYDLSVEVRSVQEIASVLSDTLGRPFHAEVHDPEDFYKALLKGGMEPTYAACARETLIRFGQTAIPGQEKTHPFDAIFEKAALTWPEFAMKHREAFLAG